MSERVPAPASTQRITRIVRRLGRTLLVVVPLHLVAFVLLYLGLLQLVQREMLFSHGEAARVFARELVDDLHPVMVVSDPREIRKGLAEFSAAHDLLNLEFFDADGRPIAAHDPQDSGVAAFLEDGETTAFELVSSGNSWSVDGLVRVTAHATCESCHQPGEVLGVAAMSYDVTPLVAAATGRLRRSIAVLVLGWIALVGAVSMFTGRAALRSLERVRADVSRRRTGRGSGIGPAPGLMLNPVSAELYSTLKETVEHQRQREEQVVSRLHHTDRLASLGQLAAGLAHEIKNPIAGIHGALEILRDDTDDEAKRALFEQMLAETRRVNETIQSLLRLARPARPRPISTDIDALLESTAQLLEPGFRKRRVNLEHLTSPNLQSYRLDPDQIRQVLVNLVTNAADAMEDGGTVSMRAAPLSDVKGLIIAVEDDGPGMELEVQQRVFEPFFTTKHTGTGLGLAVASTLVAQHGGSLEVQSEPGQGSTFMVVLPEIAPDPAIDSGTDRSYD